MEKVTEKILQQIEQMQNLIPDLASSGVGKRIAIQLAKCERYASNSISRNEQARTARLETVRAFVQELCSAAQHKDRVEELVFGLLLIAPPILNGGKVPDLQEDRESREPVAL